MDAARKNEWAHSCGESYHGRSVLPEAKWSVSATQVSLSIFGGPGIKRSIQTVFKYEEMKN